MPDRPIGITFIPNAEQATAGPQQGRREGDVETAVRILSLRTPRVLGARAIAPQNLINSQGSESLPGGQNPMAALFQALLQSMAGGGGGDTAGGVGGAVGGLGPNMAPSTLTPRVIPGINGPFPPGQGPLSPDVNQPLPTPSYTPAPGTPVGFGNAPDVMSLPSGTSGVALRNGSLGSLMRRG